jgi:transposase
MRKQCIAVDISNESFTACAGLRQDDDTLKFSARKKFTNDRTGHNQLMRWRRSIADNDIPTVFLMEATGVYHERLAYYLHNLEQTVHVVLPNKSKHYFKSLNVKTKTDSLDARILAQFGLEREHSIWTPPSPVMLELRGLSRYRMQLQDQRTALSNILHSKNRAYGTTALVKKSNERLIRITEQEIKKVGDEMEKLIQSDPELEQRVKKICTIQGVAIQTVLGLIAETDGFTLFHSTKQLTSYSGYDVVHEESGTIKRKTRISKKGNSYIRRIMYMPAMSASQHVPEFKALRQRILDKTKIPMKAQVAIQRKLLILIYTLWKNGTEYIPDHHGKKIAQTEVQAKQDSAEAIPLS